MNLPMNWYVFWAKCAHLSMYNVHSQIWIVGMMLGAHRMFFQKYHVDENDLSK
jgi:hypothetical protein